MRTSGIFLLLSHHNGICFPRLTMACVSFRVLITPTEIFSLHAQAAQCRPCGCHVTGGRYLIRWEGDFPIAADATLNALRFITKNILTIVAEQSAAIDWLNHYMVLPLAQTMPVKAGDRVHISFQYRAGGSIASLQHAISACLANEKASQESSGQILAMACPRFFSWPNNESAWPAAALLQAMLYRMDCLRQGFSAPSG